MAVGGGRALLIRESRSRRVKRDSEALQIGVPMVGTHVGSMWPSLQEWEPLELKPAKPPPAAGLLRAFKMLMGSVTVWDTVSSQTHTIFQLLKDLSNHFGEELISFDPSFGRHRNLMPRGAECFAQGDTEG